MWWFQTFLFSPVLGEMIQIDENIFQMGWFNHQLVFDTNQPFVPFQGSVNFPGWKEFKQLVLKSTEAEEMVLSPFKRYLKWFWR